MKKTNFLKIVARVLTPRFLKEIRTYYRNTRPLEKRECPLCGYRGFFLGRPPRVDAQCPAFGSLERHRLFGLLVNAEQNLIKSPV